MMRTKFYKVIIFKFYKLIIFKFYKLSYNFQIIQSILVKSHKIYYEKKCKKITKKPLNKWVLASINLYLLIISHIFNLIENTITVCEY